MTYAFMQDIAASWQDYDRIMATTFDPIPFGLIVHLAGPTDEGIRIINLWESEQAWQAFESKRLIPADSNDWRQFDQSRREPAWRPIGLASFSDFENHPMKGARAGLGGAVGRDRPIRPRQRRRDGSDTLVDTA
jgi:hypothetical protein